MIADFRLWCWGTRLRAAAGKGTVCLTRGREEGEGQLAAHRAADQSVREQSRERLTDSLILSSSPHLYYATHQLSSVLLHVFFTFSSPTHSPFFFAPFMRPQIISQSAFSSRIVNANTWSQAGRGLLTQIIIELPCNFVASSKVQLSICILFTSTVLQSNPCTQTMSRKELSIES